MRYGQTCGRRGQRQDLFTQDVDGQPVQFVRPADTDASGVFNDGLERFLDEARRTAALEHPAIVKVYDVGVDRDLVSLLVKLSPRLPQGRVVLGAPRLQEPRHHEVARGDQLAVEFAARLGSLACRPPVPAAQVQPGRAGQASSPTHAFHPR